MKRSRISKLGHILGIASIILGISYNIFCYLTSRWYELDHLLIGIILILISDFSITLLENDVSESKTVEPSLQPIVKEHRN